MSVPPALSRTAPDGQARDSRRIYNVLSCAEAPSLIFYSAYPETGINPHVLNKSYAEHLYERMLLRSKDKEIESRASIIPDHN